MGYVVTVLVIAVPTFLAVVAPRRTPLQARLSFLGGLVVNEMPVWPALWIAGATALAWADGTLRAIPGAVGAGLAVATAIGLAVILRRGLAARPVLARALAEAGLTRAAEAVRHGVGRDLVAGFLPFVVGLRVVRRRDLAYGPHGRRNLLDVYLPRRPARTALAGASPVLVYFHGGGYASGRKDREARLLMHRAVRRGWVAVSAAYRLRPDVGMLEHVADADAAIAWVRAHADGLGADPGTVVVAGSSAGAHLASIVALRRSDPARAGSAATVPHTGVAAVVGLYGWYGDYFGGGTTPADPGDLAHADAPPFLVVHGDQDTYVPPAVARRFVARLRATSRAPVVHAELPGAQHGFDLLRSPRFSAVTDAVLVALDELLTRRDGPSTTQRTSDARNTHS